MVGRQFSFGDGLFSRGYVSFREGRYTKFHWPLGISWWLSLVVKSLRGFTLFNISFHPGEVVRWKTIGCLWNPETSTTDLLWINPPLKNMSQNGNLLQIEGMNIFFFCNHHLRPRCLLQKNTLYLKQSSTSSLPFSQCRARFTRPVFFRTEVFRWQVQKRQWILMLE